MSISNENNELSNFSKMVTRKIKPKKCCTICSGNLCFPVKRSYAKRKTQVNLTVTKDNSCASAKTVQHTNKATQSNKSLQSVNNSPTKNCLQDVRFQECSINLENVDISKYSKVLKVNLFTNNIQNTEESTTEKNLFSVNHESEIKPVASVDEDSLLQENVEIIISDDDDDNDNEDNRCTVINAERDLTSITYLKMIDVERQNKLFPDYCQQKIEEMREFFANQSSVLKPFAKSENYTIEEILELMSKPTRWLTESDINSYFALIEKASQGRMTFYRTFFMSPNTENPSEPIKFNIPTSMSDVGLFSKHMLMIPLNLHRSHWALVCFDFTSKTVFYYDSLYCIKNNYVLCIFFHLKRLAETLNIKLDPEDWKLQENNSPKQNNFYDCGIFVCACAWFIVQGKEPDFEQSDVPLIRQRMAYELMHGELIF